MERGNLPSHLQYSSEACTLWCYCELVPCLILSGETWNNHYWLIYRQIYQYLFLIDCCDRQLPSNSLGFAASFLGVAGSWHARWGSINPYKVFKMKGSDIERPKALTTFLWYITEDVYHSIVMRYISHTLLILNTSSVEYKHLLTLAYFCTAV